MPLTIRRFHHQRGQLLLEVLVAVAIIVIIATVGIHLIYTSLVGTKSAGDRNVGLGLTEETFEAVEAAATEKWQNLYDLTKGSANYHPQKSSGQWVLTSATEDVVINSITYTRSFTIQNVCRDDTTRAVTGITTSGGSTTDCASGSSHDPSTQRVTAVVSWPNADALTSSQYLSRWRNKLCEQTTWSGTSGEVKDCPDTTYESATDITPGESLELPQS